MNETVAEGLNVGKIKVLFIQTKKQLLHGPLFDSDVVTGLS